jgi:Kef-type K+ transport system membrane component KefB
MSDVASNPPGLERPPETRRRVLLLYVGVIAVALVLVNIVLRLGDDLESAGHAVPERGEGLVNTHEVLWRLLLAAAVIILMARFCGAVARRIGQPQVIGEIVAGIILGPSVLGALFPTLSDDLFRGDVLPFIEILAQIGLIVFMFLVGLEFDPRLLKGRGDAAALISHLSIVIPFVLGLLLGLATFTELGPEGSDFLPYALFLGASMSITAFPVLARILTERGLHRTRLGATVITCAAIDDVTAWCVLAVVVAVATADGLGSAFTTIALALVFIAFMLALVRPAMRRLASYHEETGRIGSTLLALLFVGVLVSALATDQIGIHAIFGAFLFGAVMPKRAELVEEVTEKLVDFTVIFLLPLFFAYSGLRTELGLLDSPGLWLTCLAIIVIAIVGKWGGSTFGARWVGMPWRESMAVGILMNCRGLTELVILNIGLDLGVIPPVLFTMLVIMALVTTFMTSPLLGRVISRDDLDRMVAEADQGAAPEDVFEIVVHLPDLDRAYELVHTALSLAHDQHQDVRVVLLRTIVLDTDFTSGTLSTEASSDRAAAALRPVVEFVRGAGYDAVPVIVQTASVGETIVGVANARRPELVLMTWRRPLFGSGLVHGAVGDVLRAAETDVAVLIDPAGKGTSPRKGSEIVVPYGGGMHEDIGLELALRLARTHGASVHLLGDDTPASAQVVAAKAAEVAERSGVLTTATSAPGDFADAIIDAATAADLTVLGLGDDWARDSESLGDLRELVAARSPTPMLLVRRAAPPGSGRRGQRKSRERIAAANGNGSNRSATTLTTSP